ncbi:MAG: hypothetical protein US83_C0020G0007 [Candidatus Falkowbacteria bacterium GW2011_GWC2_38_22]|nr:MAG: hypothetical protein US83_C0020G0007 [Candidatus Falkowbacteria bacterium GW2011_GWC2_38_22]KKQ62370.1 MAG: hypothetical protein US84_C0018G0004 [Candidatus Falkowbacteria bacterium GW2011_GWF1_38_22]KKQ71576.1 MAG: hypothetical protein US93_C0017G0004 [Candidatus Falkowbacteria bacterium GW2011_GWD2_38_42]HAM88877.1 hypothetical protein [Candidatus Falkowbacteria bacterium]HAY12674.1 hypothetical protein [Candidatus Falkowbacteria bacterium]
MKKIIKNKAIVWDYDFEKIDLKKARDKAWFLTRKLRFGDLSGINKKDLKDNLANLDISDSLKELLTNFLYAKS